MFHDIKCRGIDSCNKPLAGVNLHSCIQVFETFHSPLLSVVYLSFNSSQCLCHFLEMGFISLLISILEKVFEPLV